MLGFLRFSPSSRGYPKKSLQLILDGLMQRPAKSYGIFTSSGWDFVAESENGTKDIWKIFDGLDYPHLCWEKFGGARVTRIGH